MARADWLVKLRISYAIYLQAAREKMASGLHPWQVKKSSKLIVCGVYYLTVLVYTKTIIHLSVGESGGYLPRCFAARQISTTIHLHFGE